MTDTPSANICRGCRNEVRVLVHDPNSPTEARRTVCGKCAGDANRRVLDSLNGRDKWESEQ